MTTPETRVPANRVPMIAKALGDVRADAFAVRLACAGQDPTDPSIITLAENEERGFRAELRRLGLSGDITYGKIRTIMIATLRSALRRLEEE